MTIRQQNLFLLVIGVVYFLSHHQNVIIAASAKARTWLKQKDTVSIMNGLQVLTQHGRVLDVLAFCDEIEDEFGTLAIEPNISPSIYTYKGVALYQLQRMNDSEKQFLTAISKNPNETRAWINLGEIQVQTFRLTESIHSFEKAFLLGDLTTLPRIVRAKGWSMDWKDFEIYASDLEKHATICTHDPRKCLIDSSGGFEYTDASGEEFLLMQKASPHAVPGKDPIEKRFLAPYWPISEYGRKQRTEKRLKLGFVSSDFGVHPVSNLIRGMLHFLDKSKFEVYCFSLHPELSWWGLNISTQVEHFIPLPKTNIRDGSALIASFQIEILIELNGHTLNSGLNLLSYRPAPVQMTYLGLPTSAGATFVDYFIGDYVALPAEHRQAFSEHLVLMKPCYISNDYAQVQGDILEMPQAARTELIEHSNILNATILLGTLSNSQKVDPDTFHTWMNIMRRFAGSKMLFMQYAGAKYYVPNIAKQAQLHGISLERIFSRPQIQWIDHLYAKSALDLVLDTRVKNGHTTGLDGVWAGVPTLTFGGGKDMQSRAGQSIAASLDSDIGVAFSLKEYEDIAISLLRNKKLDPRLKRKVDKALKAAAAKLNSDSSRQDKSPTTEGANEESTKIALDAFTKADLMASVPSYERLKKWREKVGSLRNSSYLFDSRKWTKSLEHLMEASWEIYNIYSKNNWKPFHIFSRTELPEYDSSTHFPVGQIYSQGSKYFNRPGNNIDEAVQAAERKFNNNQPQQLHKVHIHSTDHIMEVERSGEVDNDNDSAGIDEARLKLTAPKKKAKKSYVPIPKYVFDGRLLLLNIGGMRKAEGWLNVNAQNKNYKYNNAVDILREMHDLKGLPNNSVSAIYCSHTLEHVPFGNGLFNKTLIEWHRVIRPGGILLISVPDLETIARMYIDPNMTVQDRWFLSNVIFGGQQNEFDYHQFGYSFDILNYFLGLFGFCNIRRVGPLNMAFHDERGYFTDSSDITYRGYVLSLNIVARVCPQSKPDVAYDKFDISDNAFPYDGYKVSDYPENVRVTFYGSEGGMTYV